VKAQIEIIGYRIATYLLNTNRTSCLCGNRNNC